MYRNVLRIDMDRKKVKRGSKITQTPKHRRHVHIGRIPHSALLKYKLDLSLKILFSSSIKYTQRKGKAFTKVKGLFTMCDCDNDLFIITNAPCRNINRFRQMRQYQKILKLVFQWWSMRIFFNNFKCFKELRKQFSKTRMHSSKMRTSHSYFSGGL